MGVAKTPVLGMGSRTIWMSFSVHPTLDVAIIKFEEYKWGRRPLIYGSG